MLGLGTPLPFSLGGPGLSSGKPWIVNLRPRGEEQEAKLLRPVRFSVRDSETYIDPAQLLVEVGYAKVHSEADALFDGLPRTRRIPFFPGTVLGDPTLEITGSGQVITKTSSNPQRGIYATSVDVGTRYASAMVSAVVRPDVITPDTTPYYGPGNQSVYPPMLWLPYNPGLGPLVGTNVGSTVIGLEHGPRNKAVYFWFELAGATKGIRCTGPILYVEEPVPNSFMAFDWSDFCRYTLVWNEAQGYVEFYADSAGSTTRLFRFTIDSIPEMPDDYHPRSSTRSDVVAVYGQDGAVGDQSTWQNIAVTADVGYPVLGNIRPGDFRTVCRGAELVRMSGSEDPRDADVSAWFETPDEICSDPDPDASGEVDDTVFNMTKPTLGKTFAVFRQEPGFLHSTVDGFMVQAAMIPTNTRQDSASTGVGITIYDGQSVFQLTLFNDFATKTVGLLKKDGSDEKIGEHFTPDTPFDWSTGRPFRFVVDPRLGTIQLFDTADLSTPLMEIPFDRASLPDGADKGWADFTPFIAFGHTTPVDSSGTVAVRSVEYCHMYQAWESRSGLVPHHINTDPMFSGSIAGSPAPTITMDAGGLFQISSAPGTTAKMHREAPFGANRGAILEARLKIVSYRARHRTGTYLILDDGLRAYALTFVENAVGRFVAISKKTGVGGFVETVGRDGDAAALSFLFDWTQLHTYRMERRPYDGLYVFVDQETEARLFYPEKKMAELPDVQFSGTPKIAFGQFSTEGAVSHWDFVRGFFSAGYEISTKKNRTDAQLREDLFATQAIVAAYAQDQD